MAPLAFLRKRVQSTECAPSLPTELVIIIFRNIARDAQMNHNVFSSGSINKSALRKVCAEGKVLCRATQVCRRWYAVGVGMLDAIPVVLVGPRHIASFERTIKASPYIVPHVKELWLIDAWKDFLPYKLSPTARHDAAAQRTTDTILGILAILTASSLSTLMFAFGDHSPPQAALDSLKTAMQTTPSIYNYTRKLVLHHAHSRYPARFCFVGAIVGIEVLCLSGNVAPGSIYAYYHAALHTLQFIKTVDHPNFRLYWGFKEALFGCIRTLEWYHSRIPLKSLIDECLSRFSNLFRLALIGPFFDISATSQPVRLDQLPKLRHLVLGTNTLVLNLMLPGLCPPPNLVTFGIAATDWRSTSPSSQLGTVRSTLRCLEYNSGEQRLGELKSVTVFADPLVLTNKSRPNAWMEPLAILIAELREFCSFRGISLGLCGQDIDGWINTRLSASAFDANSPWL